MQLPSFSTKPQQNHTPRWRLSSQLPCQPLARRVADTSGVFAKEDAFFSLGLVSYLRPLHYRHPPKLRRFTRPSRAIHLIGWIRRAPRQVTISGAGSLHRTGGRHVHAQSSGDGTLLVCQFDRDRIDRSSRRQPPLEVPGGRGGTDPALRAGNLRREWTAAFGASSSLRRIPAKDRFTQPTAAARA